MIAPGPGPGPGGGDIEFQHQGSASTSGVVLLLVNRALALHAVRRAEHS